MNRIVTEDEVEEKPLDPAMEKVRRKMVRLLVVSIGIMMAGLMAVLFTIVYKTSSDQPAGSGQAADLSLPPVGEMLTGDIALPSGAEIRSHSLDAGRIALQVQLVDGTRRLYLYDLAARRMIGSFNIVKE